MYAVIYSVTTIINTTHTTMTTIMPPTNSSTCSSNINNNNKIYMGDSVVSAGVKGGKRFYDSIVKLNEFILVLFKILYAYSYKNSSPT